MASRKPKRPSSARRHIKYECFSQFVSAARLRRVGALLKDPKDSSSSSPDAVLCISGIDSRYNDGSRELINYLLFGFFEVRKFELEKSGFDDEVIDDMIILVKRDSVDVYCNPINYHYLLPYVSHWYNIRFHCMTETEYEDEEAAEEFKIRSFINMMQGCKKVAIPYSSTAHVQQFDKFSVEKWPIVQAYALEGLGGGGFFTMVHEVCDLSAAVHDLYSRVDPVALEILLTEHLPLLERQWKNMTATMDIEINDMCDELSGERLFEPIKSFFQHGRATTGNGKMERKFPFLLFGNEASKSGILQAQSNEGLKMEKGHARRDSVHTILCQAVDPKGPLTCARTYFLTPGLGPFKDDAEYKACTDTDVGNLVLIYKAMTEAVMKGIETYSQTLSVTQARLKAMQCLLDGCGDLKTSTILDYLSERSSVKFTIEGVDNWGRPYPLKEDSQCLMVKVATMTLYDVPSCLTKGKRLGSLIFAETFLESVIPVNEKGLPVSTDSDVLVLTSHLPRIQLWTQTKQDIQRQREVEDKLKLTKLPRFGDVLLPGDAVQVTTGAVFNSPPTEATLYLYENGIIVQTSQCGAFSLHAQHIKSLHLCDGESISNIAFLIADLDMTSRWRLPPHLLSSSNRLILVISPRSKARKALFQQALPRWKDDDNPMPSVQRMETIPEDLARLYKLLQIQHSFYPEIISPVNTMTFKKVPSVLPDFKRFLPHFTASSVGWHPVRKQDLSCLLGQDSPAQDESDWIPVTIISGIPGSSKDNLAKTISKMDNHNTRWTMICQPQDSGSSFDPVSLQNSLTNAYSLNRRRHTSGNFKRTRVIIITPGYTDIIDVVHAIVSHPNPEVAAQIKIGAVSACIDPLNTFMEHRMTFPSLLNHCAQGWVNCIVFTSSTNLKNETLEDVQTLVRSVNSDVALLLAEGGHVTRSPDLELIMSESSFHLPPMVSSRLLLHPGWHESLYLQSSSQNIINRVVLRFSKPLDRHKLHQNLKALRKTQSSLKQDGNIYHVEGRVCFTDSRQIVDVQYVTPSGHMTSSPSDDQTVPPSREMNGQPLREYFLAFSGCKLQEGRLKDWLRTCAPEKPEKKKILTRGDLKKAEISQIHKTHHLETLPPGWFYNGTQFISMSGDKADTHPNLDEFVKTWLEKKNEEITSYNAKIDSQAFTDLFD